jgi:hypothetical protein
VTARPRPRFRLAEQRQLVGDDVAQDPDALDAGRDQQPGLDEVGEEERLRRDALGHPSSIPSSVWKYVLAKSSYDPVAPSRPWAR